MKKRYRIISVMCIIIFIMNSLYVTSFGEVISKTVTSNSEQLLSQGLKQGYISIQEVRVSEGFYEMDLNYTSDVKSIKVATWTEANGQDDIVWDCYDFNYIGDTSTTVYVYNWQHNYQTGTYISHVYAYDALGNVLYMVGTQVDMISENPFVSVEGAYVNNQTYQIHVRTQNNVADLSVATWTEANGQDDVVWQKIAVSSNEALFYINVSEHNNESGNYITHINAYDINGRYLGITQYIAYIENVYVAPVVFNSVNQSLDNYSINLSLRYDVAYLQIATWTEVNGQDDIVWRYYDTKNHNNYDAWITTWDHNNEAGTYINHIYAYDESGKMLDLIGVNVYYNYSKPIIYLNQLTNTDTGCEIEYTLTANRGAKKIVCATWTEANGQDDIVWREIDFTGGSNIENILLSVDKANHNNEAGLYHTHIYFYDNDDNMVLLGCDYNMPDVLSNLHENEMLIQ